MRLMKNTAEYGNGLITIPERVEVIERGSAPAKPYLVSTIHETRQKSIMDIGLLLDVLADESIL